MRECSYGETGNEFFANFPVFWPIRACFAALAHGLGALMMPTLESFACAPYTSWFHLNLTHETHNWVTFTDIPKPFTIRSATTLP